jgi:uncharacterized protein (UPF0333 family)
MNDPITPGWKTSEFWLSLAHLLFAVLISGGFLAITDATKLESQVSSFVAAAFALISSSAVVWRYIQDRTQAKMAAMIRQSQPSDEETVE